MLENTPEHDGNPTSERCIFETKTGQVDQTSAGRREDAPWKPRRALQEVRQGGVPLCPRQRARPRLLPLGNFGARPDSFLLCLRETEKTCGAVSTQLPEVAEVGRRDHGHQPPAVRTRRLGRWQLNSRWHGIPTRSWQWIQDRSRKRARSPFVRFHRYGTFWLPCFWTP